MSGPARFEDAVAAQQRGDAARADALCVEVLSAHPLHADAWHLRGLLAFQRGSFGDGIGFIESSLACNPRQGAAHANLGSARLHLNQPDAALRHFEQALSLGFETAATQCGRGGTLLRLGRVDDALAAFQRAMGVDPGFAPAYNGCAQALLLAGRAGEAIDCLMHPAAQSAGNAEGRRIAGDALIALGRPEEALAAYTLALDAGPPTVELLNNRGNALRDLHRFAAALDSYDRALALAPQLAETLNNRGNALLDLGRLPEALACYEAALAGRPEYPEALENRGLVLVMMDRPQEAAICYERLRRATAPRPFALSQLIKARYLACDWSRYTEEREALLAEVRAGQGAHPFVVLAVTDAAEQQFLAARRFAATSAASEPPPLWSGERYRHRRLRVAYVSADFRRHAVAHVMAGVFECHDRRRIESVAIALRPGDGSPVAQRIHSAFEHYIDVDGRSDRQIAEQMRSLEIDVAVDLMGYTQWCRPGIFAHRPAPVQVNFLGYPGTTAAPAMDFIVADDIVVPPADEPWYGEQVLRLPSCYLPQDDRRAVEPGWTRARAGLPERGFVFCAFSNPYKINPPLFDIWMRLLRDTPDAVLWLRGLGAAGEANLRREAEVRGVHAARLVFAPSIEDAAGHLGRQSLADLYLDTFPYNAHSTAGDALWAGVPVLTCAGRGFASRVASSVLCAADLPELVAAGLPHYERLALEFTRDREHLTEIRARLSERRTQLPLFATGAYTRRLEDLLSDAHRGRLA